MLAFLKRYCWVVLTWTGLFVLLVVPFTALYEWNVSKRPVVTALVSNPSLEFESTKDGGSYNVFGSLDYDRPTSNGLVHCHLEKFFLGTSGTADAKVWTFQLAVHPDTCEEPVRLPIRAPTTFGEWSAVYLAGCVLSALIALVVGPLRSDSTGESDVLLSAGTASAIPESVTQGLRLRLPNRRIYTEYEQQYDNAPLLMFGILSIPIIVGLAVLPFWDSVGDWPFIVALDRFLAPAIGHLPDVHQLAATRRRYLVGSSAIMYGVFLSQIILLLFSKKRRFVLLEGYDLRKLHFFKTLLVTWASMIVGWYVLFVVNDGKSTSVVASVRLVQSLLYVFPFLVLLAGQTTTVAILGVSRDIIHFVRRLRSRSSLGTVVLRDFREDTVRK
ncbi:MAG: hypothetical protein WBQ24_06635 [Xanthobacteraceae bacterium]